MRQLVPILAITALFLGLASVTHAQSTAPTISSVAITSNPGPDDTYATGDTITVTFTFSEAVTVDTTNGTPYVVLGIGGSSGFADYSGDGSGALAQPFSHTVRPLNRDADGVSLRENSLRLRDGTIRATDDSANATLTHPAMAFPDHKVAAGGEVSVGLGQVGIALTVDLDNGDRRNSDEGMRSTSNEAWQWQRSATEDGPYSDIPASEGGTSIPYTPSAGDLGKWLKATVTYNDATGTGWTGEATTQVLSQPALSNASYTNWNMAGFGYPSPGTYLYAQGFTTGSDTRGYRLAGVRLALSKRERKTVEGTWGVHADDAGKPAAAPLSAALPILNADLDVELDTFEEFTHPHGVHLEPDTKYWTVISQTSPNDDGNLFTEALTDWNGSLGEGLCESRHEGYTTSQVVEEYATPLVDPGSEDGWSLDPGALAYVGNEPYPGVAVSNQLTELVPWHLLATSLELSEVCRFVLRMSLLVAPDVTVQFTQGSYTVAEGGTQTVTVQLSADPERTLVIPITTTDEDGATSADYSVPSSVTFIAGETSKSFDLTATQDTVDDDEEGVKLGFGTMPDAWVRAGTRSETSVSIEDDDDPYVTVQFGQGSQGVGEGETVNVTVSLNADPERTVTIPVTSSPQGTASAADYTVPTSVTFNDGEMEKTITFMAVNDEEDDDDESVKLGFGSSLPARVTAGTRTETTLNIGDDDDPTVTVMFSQTTYTVDEGGTQSVTVTLSADPERTIIIPITPTLQGTASDADYSGVPPSVKFNSGETSKTFDFEATQDEIDDDGEGVKLGFGTMPDPRVSAGTPDELTLSITDDDTAALVVRDESLTVGEGESSSYTVNLATEPTDSVTVAISGHAGTALMLSGATLTSDALTFTAANWNTAQTVTVTADHDDNSINEDVTLTHTATGGGYTTLTDELSVSVTDDDTPAIVLTPVGLTVGESDTASYTVRLATEPTAGVTVTISGHAGTDLSLSGTTLTNDALTFTTTNWDTAQTVTVAAAHDADSANDTATLTHTGGGEYAGVNSRLPVVVTDDDTGALRLVDGVLTDEQGRLCEGRLEIYYNGAWGTICDDYWNKNNADVACRALGFVASVEDFNRYRTAYFAPGTEEQEIVLDDLNCNGDESGLLECPSGQPGPGFHNCRHSEDVGLRCLKVGQSPPWIVDVEFSDPPGGNGTYDAGETLEATLVWSEPVTISTPSGGLLPKVWVVYGSGASGHTDIAEYASGSGTARTVFRHTLTSGSHSLVGVSYNSLRVRDGSIVSLESGLDAELGHSSYYSAQSENQAEAVTIIGVPTFNGPGPDNSWGAGEAVEVTFIFSRPVQVDTTGGAPSLPVLLSGTATRQALYLRGSGTRQLVFGYTLADADGTHSSLLVAPDSLALNGGSIQDVNYTLDAAIEHQGAGAFYAQQVVDETAPELRSAAVDGAALTLTYNEDLDTGVTLPESAFAVMVGDATRSLDSVSVSGSAVTLTLATAVESGDTVTTDYTVPTGESANKLQDASGNAAESFSGQAVTNNTTSSGTPRTSPTPAPGAPNSLKVARHESGKLLASWSAPDSGATPTGYTAQWKESVDGWDDADDVSEANVKGTSHVITGLTDGVEYAVRVVARKGDSDGDPSGEVTATPQETVAPTLSAASVDGPTLAITFDEALDTDETPDKSAFSVTVAGSSRGVDTVSVSGSGVTLTLVTAVTAGDAVTVDYTAPADDSAVGLQDLAGNAAASFSGLDAGNDTQAADQLTATVHDVPGSHDGSTVFTFELRFSENFYVSYKTLRDHAFTVMGGEVTGARRLAPPSHIGWEIQVEPDGDGAATIVLPVTTDCTAEGAICTQDRRPLSGGLLLVVPGPNTPATGAPTIRGTAQVGETLAADTTGIADDDGLDSAAFSYQWLAGDAEINGATASTYTLVAADAGKAIKVQVSFTDDAGNDEEMTSAATAAVAAAPPPPNTPATGLPTISGTAQVGDTLAAVITGIEDADGLDNVVFSYQWIRNDGGADTDISGATGSSYTLGDSDVDKTVKVRVSFTDDANNRETVTSAATAAVDAKPNTPATGEPTINGTAQVGEALTADVSGIADEDGLTNASLAYQWQADGGDISGATGSTYTLAVDDESKVISVKVSFSDDAGNAETLTSAATAAVEPKPNTPATGLPTISGTVQVGETLTADTSGIADEDGLTNVAFAYQWQADGVDISGSTGETYTLVAADAGKAISVTVSFTDDRGHQEELTSAATEAVAGLPPPPLTASLENAATSHDGESVFTFELRFSEEFGISYKTLRNHAFSVTGGTVKKAQRLEQGSNIGWKITVRPDGNGQVSIILPVTTDCADTGAICTEDGRKLSHRLELTVSGPGG